MSQELNIVDIYLAPELQIRSAIISELVTEYADAMENGAVFPPIVCFKCQRPGTAETLVYLVDGFHRLNAYKERSVKTITVEVREEPWEQAIKAACCLNNKNGLRFSREELKKATTTMLDTFGTIYSDTQLAFELGCHRKTVAKLREDLGIGNSYARKAEKVLGKVGSDCQAFPQKGVGTTGKTYISDDNTSVRAIAREAGVCNHTAKKALERPKQDSVVDTRKDALGHEIPPARVEEYDMLRSRIQGYLTKISAMRSEIEALFKNKERPFVDRQTVVLHLLGGLDTCYDRLKGFKIEAVCTCQGDGCKRCLGNGFLTLEDYKTIIPHEEQ